MRKYIVILGLLGFCSCSDPLFVDDGDSLLSGGAIALPDPGTLRGVHWLTYTDPTFDETGRLVAAAIHPDPTILTDEQKVSMVAQWGINCIALKLEDGGQMTSDWNPAGSDDKSVWEALSPEEREILNDARTKGCAEFIKAAHQWTVKNPHQPVYVMLFTRMWFERGGNLIDGNMEAGAKIFADVIDICRKGGYDDIIIGVHAVENRINAMNSLLPRCLQFADEVNAKTDNWLKNKAYFFSGLGMGISFKSYASKSDLNIVGIDKCSGADTFWADIQERCSAFTWVHKQYAKWEPEVDPTFCTYATEHIGANGTYTSYDMARERLLNACGHTSLKQFVSRAPSEMFNNVLFWGDAADGVKHLNGHLYNAIKDIWFFNGYNAALFYHLFDKEAANNADTWNDMNNITYLLPDKSQRPNMPAYTHWSKFFDKKPYGKPW